MKKTTAGIIILVISILGLACFLTLNTKIENKEAKEKEVPVYAIHADYNLDVDNPNAVVGGSDYVFVGKVTENTGTTYKDKAPLEQEDGSIKYVGEAFTNYKIKVLYNLKNELVTNNEITLAKQGGIREDGSAYDIFEDDLLPEIGKVYIFNAYTQDDGSLLVSGANSTISFDEKTQNIDTQKELAKTEEVQQYENAVDNQILTEENNLNSDFDASQEQ
ncbi:cell surface protein [Listeria monocytogenes]|nr:cell surface protein [Listeria monocytogenes]EKA2553070.1 cell surface protein [Listeria monocytogenes]EKA2556228.1 cell surface protein [Listeria monocytogenes]EKA2559352.1 cell surface protein [Listeria monocytogenes]EKA2562520.1 cell surface protein [Listeria monocytogenes]